MGGSTVEVMDVTETERLWTLGLLLQDGGEDRGFIKDDIPEEFVSMEWTEEHDEDDSESWKSKHTPEEHGTIRTVRFTVFKAQLLRLRHFHCSLHSSPQCTCIFSLV